MQNPTGFKTTKVLFVCLGLSLAFAAAAATWGIEKWIVARPHSELAGKSYARMWFAPDGRLIGLRTGKDRVAVDLVRVKEFGVDSTEVELAAPAALLRQPEQPLIAVREDATLAAWIEDRSLVCQSLGPAGAAVPSRIDIGRGTAVSVVMALADGGVAVVYADSLVEVWDCESKAKLSEQRLEIEAPTVIKRTWRYFLAATLNPAVAFVYRARGTGDWQAVEKRYGNHPTETLQLSPVGRLMITEEEGLTYGDTSIATPGPIREAVFPGDREVFVTGEFDGVYRLRGDEDPQKVCDAPPSTRALAAEETLFGFSSAEGTQIHRLEKELHLTTKGKIWAGLSLLSISALPLKFLLRLIFYAWILKLLLALFGRLSKKRKKLGLPEAIPLPLRSAAEEGELALFAGSGLSAGSGLPTWRQFADGLLRYAKEQEIVSDDDAKALENMIETGRHNTAVNLIVDNSGDRRPEIERYYRDILLRPVVVSGIHRKIGEIGFRAGVTTNYDYLLEQAQLKFAKNTYSAGNPFLGHASERGWPLLLRLYGDLQSGDPAPLSQEEFVASTAADEEVRKTLNRLLDYKTMIFIGCSVDGLLHDLEKIEVRQASDVLHFALVGVKKDEEWEEGAERLSKQYGIEVLPFNVENPEEELYEFLTRLAECQAEKEQKAAAASA